VLQRALAIQRIVLSRFLAADTLTSLQEVALHADAGQEVLQMSEVFDALTNSIWSELPAPNATVKKGQTLTLSTLRRNLQREHVARLARLVLGPRRDGMMSLFLMLYGDGGRAAPADARSLGWQHLRRIDDRIADTLSAKRGLAVDPTSRAHLEEVHEQIAKVLKAAMQAGDM
jgi:hypothetical protein